MSSLYHHYEEMIPHMHPAIVDPTLSFGRYVFSNSKGGLCQG